MAANLADDSLTGWLEFITPRREGHVRIEGCTVLQRSVAYVLSVFFYR